MELLSVSATRSLPPPYCGGTGGLGQGRRVDRIFLLPLNLDERFKAKGQIIRFYSAIVTLLDDEEAYEEFRRLKGQEEIADYLNSMVKGDRKV